MERLTILLILFFATSASAVDTCSRVATINYQEVLVDVSSKNLGEGLRYYLQKDPIANDLLNEYQANSHTTWKSAALSTLGTGMILGGILRTNEGENEILTSKNFLLIGGVSMIGVSYLISKTHQFNNEYLLLRSVEEYNKRNTPKIFFSPVGDKRGMGLGVGATQEF